MNSPKLRMNSGTSEIIWMIFLQDSHFYTNFAGKRNRRRMNPYPFNTGKRMLVVLLVLSMSLTMAAQMESKLTYRRYTTQDGLPQMQTERLWQDKRGYIYIGTLSGFVRYDGHDFTPFLKGRRENIVGFTEAGDEVRALGFRRQWTTSFDNVEMHPIDAEGHWLLNNFNAGSLPEGYVLLEDEREEQRRLCRVTEQGFLPVLKGALLDEMTPDRKLCLDTTGIYVPTEKGLYRVVNGKRALRLSTKTDFYTLIRQDNQLLAFACDGIYEIRTTGMVKKKDYTFLSPDYGLIVRHLGDGRLIIADSHHLYEYDGREVCVIASGFNVVKDVLVDKWGRLWVATYEGAFCFFNRCFTTHRLDDEDDIVRAIGFDGKGDVVMGSLNGKLLVNGQVAEESTNFFQPSTVTIGDAVYLTGGSDVLRYDGKAEWLGLPQDRYVFVGRLGERLITGSRKCITAYDTKSGQTDTLTTEIPHPWCAVADGEGTLWVGSSFGLYSISKNKEVQKTDYPQKLVITTMTSGPKGHVLFASADSLFMTSGKDIEALSSQMPALAGHEIRALHYSPKGYLVIAVIEGLFVCRLSEDCMISDARYYDHTNGFVALEPLKATIAEAPDGTIWLAGVEEMTSFNPRDLLNFHQEDTYIVPPLRWWQRWWVWLLALALLSLGIWCIALIYEKRRSHKTMVHLEGAKLEKEKQIKAIREKAIKAESNELAKDIVRMTDSATSTRLTINTINGTVVLDTISIAFFKADGNYTRMVTFQGEDTILLGIGKLEGMLDPKTFVRADRSTLVNLHNISRLDAKQRQCTFRSPEGVELETSLLAPAFKRLEKLL